jgi:NitT/TauT family transport system substrate-binding protein
MRQASLSRLRQFSLAIAVAGLAFAAATSGWAKDQVRVAGLTWPGYGWWYIAKAKNLAPDLDITYQAIEDPFQSFALMSSGQLEIVSSTAEFAPIGASQNMPIRMFAYGNLSHGTDKLIMRPEVTSPADLKGKKVAVMVGGCRRS